MLAGCSGPFDRPLVLASGVTIPADTLNRGYTQYQLYCRPCHGDKGDGRGYAGLGLNPPPRDFTQGLFKWGGVAAPSLPPDAELVRVVQRGLNGTAMRPWELPPHDLIAALQYIKTLSPRWQKEPVGVAVAISADPFATRPDDGVALGRALYHAKAQCSSCHPAYVTHAELAALYVARGLPAPTEFSPGMYQAQRKESEYCLRWKAAKSDGPPIALDERECEVPVSILPPDFLRDPLRTVQPQTALVDLYRVIAAGIGGANMPTWKGALPEDELWALAHYVDWLRSRPPAERAALSANLQK